MLYNVYYIPEAKSFFSKSAIKAMYQLSLDSGHEVMVTKIVTEDGDVLDGVGVELVDEKNLVVKKIYIPTKIV